MDTLIIILIVLSPKDSTATKPVKIEIDHTKHRATSDKAAKKTNKAYYAKLEELYKQPKMR